MQYQTGLVIALLGMSVLAMAYHHLWKRAEQRGLLRACLDEPVPLARIEEWDKGNQWVIFRPDHSPNHRDISAPKVSEAVLIACADGKWGKAIYKGGNAFAWARNHAPVASQVTHFVHPQMPAKEARPC